MCAACVLSSLLALLLKKQGSDLSVILVLCTVTLIISYILSDIALSVDAVKEIFKQTDMNSDYLKVLLKCIGICFITEFTCDCCKDASQSALCGTVLLCGRICVLLTALPLFTSFLDISLKLSGGSV